MLMRLLVLAGLFVAAMSAVASAENLTVRMESTHPNIVSLRFYSNTREYLWPDNDDVFIIDDNGVHTYPLQCQSGEQICYGAWVRNDEASFWGVGPDNRENCSDCCFQCEGGETDIISLVR